MNACPSFRRRDGLALPAPSWTLGAGRCHPAGMSVGNSDLIEPGMRVRHPSRPDWGIGQVQSVTGERVTVNFEHAGKLLINTVHVTLEIVPDR